MSGSAHGDETFVYNGSPPTQLRHRVGGRSACRATANVTTFACHRSGPHSAVVAPASASVPGRRPGARITPSVRTWPLTCLRLVVVAQVVVANVVALPSSPPSVAESPAAVVAFIRPSLSLAQPRRRRFFRRASVGAAPVRRRPSKIPAPASSPQPPSRMRIPPPTSRRGSRPAPPSSPACLVAPRRATAQAPLAGPASRKRRSPALGDASVKSPAPTVNRREGR